MEIEETPAERLENLKHRLARLRFAQVKTVKAKDEDLSHIELANYASVYITQSEFAEIKAQLIATKKWDGTKKYYRHFYGFVRGLEGDIHFDLKGRDRSPNTAALVGLGIDTDQHVALPPKENDWLAGTLDPYPKQGPHFKQWTICTEQEKWFADYLLGRKSVSKADDLSAVQITKPESNCLLVFMTKILVLDDLDWLLKLRENPDKRRSRDLVVQTICRTYNMDFWYRYEAAAREARKFSGVIQPPVPKREDLIAPLS